MIPTINDLSHWIILILENLSKAGAVITCSLGLPVPPRLHVRASKLIEHSFNTSSFVKKKH